MVCNSFTKTGWDCCYFHAKFWIPAPGLVHSESLFISIGAWVARRRVKSCERRASNQTHQQMILTCFRTSSEPGSPESQRPTRHSLQCLKCAKHSAVTHPSKRIGTGESTPFGRFWRRNDSPLGCLHLAHFPFLAGAKPVSKSMLEYLNHQKQISVKSESKFFHFHSRKWIWKCRLENGGHLVAVSIC